MRIRVHVVCAAFCGVILSGWVAASESFGAGGSQTATGRVTFRVIDDQGVAVKGAVVDASLKYSDTASGFTTHKGLSDTGGLFAVEGEVLSDMVYQVAHEGYYNTIGRYWFRGRSSEGVEDGRWMPWDPVIDVVLKPKKNPIPMYARRVEAEIPVLDEPVGYDLEKGDWVAPYGAGITPDISVKYSIRYQELQEYWKKLTFIGAADKEGFLLEELDELSAYSSSYEAPSCGYMAEIVFEKKRDKERILFEHELNTNQYIVLRSRVVIGEDGEISSANYSKIYPPVGYGSGRDKNHLNFTYYFNPVPNDRNLEYDPSKNLFKGLPSWEQVRQP